MPGDALPRHFRRMAHYNTRANRLLYDACARLTGAEYQQPRPAFFHSIAGTLNHILLGDTIWMTRFEGGEAPSTNLDATLHGDFPSLRAAREAMDARIEAFAGRLDAAWLAGDITYRNNAGQMFTDNRGVLLTHLFNHQTHHRGQAHGLLSQTDVPPPSLDLHRVLKPGPEDVLPG